MLNSAINIKNVYISSYFSDEKNGKKIVKSISKYNKVDDNSKIKVKKAKQGTTIVLGKNCNFDIVYPIASAQSRVNESMVVGWFEQDGVKFLMTGDLEKAQEKVLLKQNLIPKNIAVLKVGHHGLNTSTGDDFLKQIKPSYAICSANHDIKESVMKRIKKYTSNIYNTFYNETIVMTVINGKPVVLEGPKADEDLDAFIY